MQFTILSKSAMLEYNITYYIVAHDCYTPSIHLIFLTIEISLAFLLTAKVCALKLPIVFARPLPGG